MNAPTIAVEQTVAPPDTPWTAFALQERYYADIFAFFSRRVRPREEAEDLAAATFLAAFQSLKKLRKDDPRLFLFGIARRKLADALRKRRNLSTLEQAERLGRSPHDPAPVDLSEALRKALAAIPPDQAEALMLQNLEDLGIREIAAVMNRSEKAVKALLQRGKEQLRSNTSLRSLAEEIHV